MCTTLSIVNIVAETKYIFMKFADILESTLHLDAIRFPAQINRLMDRFFFLIQITDITDNTVRFMKGHYFFFCIPKILKYNGQIWIQISCLMQTALDLCR